MHLLHFLYLTTFLLPSTTPSSPSFLSSLPVPVITSNPSLEPEPEPSHKTLEIPFELTDTNQIITTICLGTPRSCFPFKISTNMNECYILHKDLIHFGYDETSSSSYQSNNDSMWFEVHDQMLHGEIITDKLTIPDTPIELERFVFYLIKHEDALKTIRTKDYVGVLGLGKKYEDYAMSFMSQLYLTDHIDDQMFSLTYKPSTLNGVLTIGYHDYAKRNGILPTQPGNTHHKYKVVAIEETQSPMFEVKMNAIIYNDDSGDNGAKVFSVLQTVLFSPGANHIYCPNKFYEMMVNSVFYDVIYGRKMCWTETNGDYEMVKCKNKVVKEVEFGEIRFVFTKWNVKIKIEELFDICEEDFVCFAIVNYKKSEQWVMGYHFLKKFTVIFDADDYKIALKIK